MGVRRFEDLRAWKDGRALVATIYQLSAAFGHDFALRDQIRRAVVSIPSNIAEGFARFSSREFRRFVMIARGSVAEVKTHLYLAHDVGHLGEEVLSGALEACDRVFASVTSLSRSLELRIKGSA